LKREMPVVNVQFSMARDARHGVPGCNWVQCAVASVAFVASRTLCFL
jgi:hypothetical protein